ncbi:MAG: AsmA family protein [Desulfobacteraceae bacterium Eth-SRB2]|nr:MAG: AsmA family protein [Desulfobacteraceae bacterium Eth-SRB2]
MRWKWIFGIAVFLIVAVIVGIFAILSSYDFNDLKPQIARMVKDTTGRELSLKGDLELEIGLTPSLVIEDVIFRNASWGSRPELAKIRRLEVQVAVLPLIRRIILFKRLILIEPDILIETNSAGKSNLEFETVKKREVAKSVEKTTAHDKSYLSGLTFNEIRIEKGRFTYNGGQSGRTYAVTLESATASADADGPVALKLDGGYNSKPFRVKATLGPVAALTDPDKAWPVKLTSNIAGSTVIIDGAARDPINGKGLNITVTGNGRSIPEILKLFNITYIPELGPFDVTAKLTDPDGRLGLTDIDLKVGGEDMARARFTGAITDLIKGKGLDITVTGSGRSIPEILKRYNITYIPELGPFDVTAKLTDPDGRPGLTDLDLKVGSEALARARFTGAVEDITAIKGMNLNFDIQGKDFANLKKITGKPMPFNGPFSVSGNAVALSAKSYKISDLKALIQEDDLNGSIEINLAAKKPRITADLSSQKFDLRPMLSKKGNKIGEPEKDATEATSRKGKVFPDTPLPLKVLTQVDAEIELKAKQLLLPLFFLSDTTAHMVLEDGHLIVNPLKLIVGGGTLAGHFDLHVQGNAVQVATALKIDRYELGSMLKKLGINDLLHGNMDVALDLKSRGNSIAELMSGLNGKTLMVMGEGSINENAIKLLGTDLSSGLLQLLNPLKKKEKYTKINCFAGGFDIKNGLAQSSALVLDTSQVSVLGYGKIDLKTEEIDLSLKPSPKKGVGINGLAKFSLSFGELTKTLKVKGTLSNPSLSIDPTGSMITLGKAIGGVVLFGPFGLAAVLANGQLGDKNPCLAIIEAAKKGFKESESEKPEEKKSVIKKSN